MRNLIFSILIVFAFMELSCFDLDTIDLNNECNSPGEVTCEYGEMYYCSIDLNKIYVCTIVSDCENECIHELIQIMMNDIKGKI